MAKTLRIIIFAKAPLPGLVKTRLIPVLGELGAAALARRMLSDTLAKAIASQLGPVELCVSPFDHPVWSSLDIANTVAITDQGEGDLGERMARACARSIAAGEFVLLIGTDCPACDRPYLEAMAQAMVDHDAVIAAASDGGYPAIGLRVFDDSIFREIAWSTNAVLQETVERFKSLGWKFQVFPVLHDIDEPQDLKYLPLGWLS
jgi:uncharacterized protein